MGIGPFIKIRSKDQPDLINVQDTIFQWATQFKTQDLFPGRLLSDVSLSVTQVNVEHGLNREPMGWIIVDKDADESIFRSAEATQYFLPLTASGAVTVKLWVF